MFNLKTIGLASLIALFLFSILLPPGFTAEGSEQTYYSIHLASFKYLQNANKKVNSLKEKGKIVFWKKANIPNKGQFYRVFLGKYRTRAAAVAFWEKLKKQGEVSYFGIYEFKEAVTIKKETFPPGLTVRRPPDGVPKRPLELKKRFIDNQDGTITDNRTNLMWVKNGWRLEFVSAVTWQEALEKCKNFRLGGYTDWRLSSIEEWKTLIDTHKQAPAMVEPNPFVNIIVHMPYWSESEQFIGRSYPREIGTSVRAYTVMLYTGDVNHQKKSDRAFILPVRTIR